jgi:hypothetical protein
MKKLTIALAIVFCAVLALYTQAEANIDTYNLCSLKYTEAVNTAALHNNYKLTIHKVHKHSNSERAKQKATFTGEEQAKFKIDSEPAYNLLTSAPSPDRFFMNSGSFTAFKDKTNLTILKTRK